MAEQADAGIGIAALLAGRGVRLPVLEVGRYRRHVGNFIGNLLRQSAGGVGGEIEQASLIDRAALQLRHVLAGMIIQRQRAAQLRIRAQRGGEGLADGAQLEQGVLAYRRMTLARSDAVVEEVGLTIDSDGNRHAGQVILRHDGANGGIDDAADLLSISGSPAAHWIEAGANKGKCNTADGQSCFSLYE